MGIKMLVAEACQIAGETTSKHADVNDTVEVSKDDALMLARMGRAFYLEKADDPTKGTLTAAAEDKDRIKRQAVSIAAERKARETQAAAGSPSGLAAIIAEQVAAGIQAALSNDSPASAATK